VGARRPDVWHCYSPSAALSARGSAVAP
jgi:hypothetical protein